MFLSCSSWCIHGFHLDAFVHTNTRHDFLNLQREKRNVKLFSMEKRFVTANMDSEVFERYNQVDELITYLQSTLPSILYNPIGTHDYSESGDDDFNIMDVDLENSATEIEKDSKTDEKFYDPNFELVSKPPESDSLLSSSSVLSDIVLIASKEELKTLSSSLALATSIAKRSSDLLNSAVNSRATGNNERSLQSFSQMELPVVNCSFFLQFPDLSDDDNNTISLQTHEYGHMKICLPSNTNLSNLNFDRIFISWSTRLPSLISDTVFTRSINNIDMNFNLNPPEISGISELILSNKNVQKQSTTSQNMKKKQILQITKHRLLSVHFDGRRVPIPTIAEVFARLRRFAQSSNAASSVASVASSILPNLDSFFPRQSQPKDKDDNSNRSKNAFSNLVKGFRDGMVAPLLVQPSTLGSSSSPFSTGLSNNTPQIYLTTNSDFFINNQTKNPKMKDEHNEICDIDLVSIHQQSLGYENSIPTPGSKSWKTYASFYQFVEDSFISNIIPILSSQTKGKHIIPLLSSNIEFKGMDGETILSSSEEVAQFYTTLTLLRKAASSLPLIASFSEDDFFDKGTSWDVQNVTIVQSNDKFQQYEKVLVSWKSTLPLLLPTPLTANSKEQTSSNIPIYGEDLFTFKRLDKNDINGMGDILRKKKRTKYKIIGIQQKQLIVNGNNIENPETWKNMVQTISQMDGSNFVSIIRSGGANSNSGRAILTAMELLTDIWDLTTPNKSELGQDLSIARYLDRDAASSVYYFMNTLHSDLPNLLMSSSSTKTVPAEEYLVKNINLKGLLQETLSRDLTGYRQAIGFAVSSLRAALRTKMIVIEKGKKIDTKVELTSEGKIQYRVILPLRIKSLIDIETLGFAQAGMNGIGISNSVPLKIELLSTYVMNEDGLVSEHCLLESRVNGVLTPADVVSQWVKRVVNRDNNKDVLSFDSPSKLLDNPLLKTMFDVVDWGRSNGE